MKRIVVLSGAGISAESGIKTFREMGGLWEEYDVMEVASARPACFNGKIKIKFKTIFAHIAIMATLTGVLMFCRE